MKYLFADGNWLLHRAWHAYGKTSSAPEKRVPNQLLEWFCQGAVRMQCQGGAVCFDGPDVFRHKVYPLYKQNRSEKAIHKAGAFNDEGPSTSDRVNSLIPYTKELFVKHGIFAEQKEEFEADDLLISGAHYFTSKGADEVVFLARDKDLVQGISQRVKMFTPAMMKEPEKIWTVKSVLADKGMTPRQFLNYQILRGDSTDNVPSIPGIGTPMAAKNIATTFGKLSDFFETKKGAAAYKSYAAELVRNRQLVTLVKTAWTEKDIKFKLAGANQYAPALATLKSTLSKKSLF